MNHTQSTDKLKTVINELFFELSQEDLVEYFLHNIEHLAQMDDDGNFIASKEQIILEMGISCTLLRQLLKAQTCITTH